MILRTCTEAPMGCLSAWNRTLQGASTGTIAGAWDPSFDAVPHLGHCLVILDIKTLSPFICHTASHIPRSFLLERIISFQVTGNKQQSRSSAEFEIVSLGKKYTAMGQDLDDFHADTTILSQESGWWHRTTTPHILCYLPLRKMQCPRCLSTAWPWE